MSTTKPQGITGKGVGSKTTSGKYKTSYHADGAATKFEGCFKALKGHIFDFRQSKQAKMFVETMRKVFEYLRTTCDKGKVIIDTASHKKLLNLTKPIKLIKHIDLTFLEVEADLILLQLQLKRYAHQHEVLLNNMAKAYIIVMGRCTKNLGKEIKHI